MAERVQKILARAGLGSRRGCEELIRQGRVQVNGQQVKLGAQADADTDEIRVDGKTISIEHETIVIALHKPRGVLSTDKPHRGDTRPTARSLVDRKERLFLVGRLDAESEGLLLLTNDGNLANKLTHPRYEHEKEYHVQVTGLPSDESLQDWRSGVEIDEGKTAPAQVDRLQTVRNTTWLRIVMHEGRKRQVRRVAQALGHHVLRLKRVRMGPVQLDDLKLGEWRELSPVELKSLRKVLKRQSKQ